MRRSNTITLFYLAIVFISGAVVGGFANRLYMANSVGAVNSSNAPHNHAELRRKYLKDMTERLHLNPGQVTQLQQIMDATGQRMHDSRKAIEEDHARKVVALLDDNQKIEYAKMREERDRNRQQQAVKK